MISSERYVGFVALSPLGIINLSRTVLSDFSLQYQIYLFERILLCCKEIGANKKSKAAAAANKKGPKLRLQLKGRIFMQNVTDIISLAKNGDYRASAQFNLALL